MIYEPQPQTPILDGRFYIRCAVFDIYRCLCKFDIMSKPIAILIGVTTLIILLVALGLIATQI